MILKHFLIVFHKPTGVLLRCQEWLDSKAALHERFIVEKLLDVLDFKDMEIVVLSAYSLDMIRQTHGRYFTREPAPVPTAEERWQRDVDAIVETMTYDEAVKYLANTTAACACVGGPRCCLKKVEAARKIIDQRV